MRLLLCLMPLIFLVGVKVESRVFAQEPSQGDVKRAAARSADDEAERLRKQGTAESLRKAIAKYEESSPAAALREAQVSMWREPRWAAPYYWTGFALQGEWR